MNIKPTIITVAFLGAILTGCNNQEKGDNATITEKQEASQSTGGAQTFIVDTADSKVRFIGYGVGKNHPGKFKVISGQVAVTDNRVTSGDFTIDVRSMEVEEKGDMYQNKLRPHLLSGDFFDAEKFGTAKFVITGSEPYEKNDKDTSIVDGANFTVSGNLTIKGETKNVSFPAKVDLDENTLKGKADFD